MLSYNQIQDKLVDYVSNHPGCTNLQASLAFLRQDMAEDYKLDLPAALENLVDSGKLIEVEFLLPPNAPRPGAKSLLFPSEADKELQIIKTKTSINILYDNNQSHIFPLKTKFFIYRGIKR